MENLVNDKTPYEIYVIINQCENLPDFRGEKDKQKNIHRKWQVIFHETEESLATPLVEGVSNVSWMCESFLTMKSSNKPLSMTVVDDKSNIAGKVTVDMTNLPVGDKSLIKPGRKNDGSREAYKNLQPVQKLTLLSKTNSDTVLSFWIWVLSFVDIKTNDKGILNLEALKIFSKSATNLFKLPSTTELDKTDQSNRKPNLNPFETEPTNKAQAKNPFCTPEDGQWKFPNSVGQSSFAHVEPLKVQPQSLIPRYSTMKDHNPFLQLSRVSSLPGLHDISHEDRNYGVHKFKMDLIRQKFSFNVPTEELDAFKSLGQLFTKKLNQNDNSYADQEFFSLLNDLQRRYGTNLVLIKNLEREKETLIEDYRDISKVHNNLKAKLISNNLQHMMDQI